MPPNLRALTRGETALARLHHAESYVVFGAALALMSLSLVSLYWAMNLLVGLPAPFALVGALALELGMAFTAHTATTVRKPRPPRNGEPRPDGYYLHLWLIYSALTVLAQGANVWHALVSVAEYLARDPGALPPWMPPSAAYWFAGAFALLFPLGGTLFVHVSGFLRVHGADAQWVDTDARTVEVRTERARTSRAPRARTAQQPDGPPVPAARTEDTAPEPPVMLSDDERALAPRQRARLAYDRMVERGESPTAPAVAKAAAVPTEGEGAVNKSTVRRWVEQFRAEPPTASSNGAHDVTDAELEQMFEEVPGA